MSNQFNDDAMRRIAAATRRVERSPSGVPSQLQRHGVPAARGTPSWRGGLDDFMSLTGSFAVIPWVERAVYGAPFCTISGGVLTFTRSGTYLITPSMEISIASTNSNAFADSVSAIATVYGLLDSDFEFGLGGVLSISALAGAFGSAGITSVLSPSKLVAIEAEQTLQWKAAKSGVGTVGGTLPSDIDDWGFGAGSNSSGRGCTLSVSRVGALPHSES